MPSYVLVGRRFFGIIALFGLLATGGSHSVLLSQDVVVKPSYKPGPLDNPLKGWCPYPNAGEIHQPYSMVFQYISWRELEPKEGDYRFDDWEKSWDSKLGLVSMTTCFPKIPIMAKIGVSWLVYAAKGEVRIGRGLL